jgi:hypothetical protein
VHLRDLLPWRLRRLTSFFVIVLPLAFFKGWFEELRQYYELTAIFGLVAVQMLLNDLGMKNLLVARETIATPRAIAKT